MGYFGLETFHESDMAFDLSWSIVEKVAAMLKEGLKEKGNEFNTPGCVNVALHNEAFILPCIEDYADSELIEEVLRETKDNLETFIDDSIESPEEDFGGAINKKEHISACRRMLKNLNKSLTYIDGQQ